MLVGQRIVTSGIEDEHRRAADHGSDVNVMDGIDIFAHGPDAALAEGDGSAGFNHAIDVTAFLLGATRTLSLLRDCLRSDVEHRYGAAAFLLYRGLARRAFLCRWFALCCRTHHFSSAFWRWLRGIPQSQSA